MAEISLEESLGLLLARVPAPVRDYVLNDHVSTVRGLMQKHQLHVDQGDVLQRELLLMLLGQQGPAEFMKALRASGIPEATVQVLIEDINETIFKPLREKEQAGSGEVHPQITEAAVPEAPPIEAPAPPTPPVNPRGMHTMQADMQTAQAQPVPPPWQPQQYAPPAYPPMQPAYSPYPPQYMPQHQTYWIPVSIAHPQPPPQYPYPQPQYTPPPQPEQVPQAPAPTPPAPPQEPLPVATPVTPPPQYTPPPQVPLKKEFGADPYREPI